MSDTNNLPASVRRYAKYLLIMAGLGGLLYGIDVGVIAAALPYIENTASYSKTQIGFVVGMVLWGSVISSLFAGQLAEDLPTGGRAGFRRGLLLRLVAYLQHGRLRQGGRRGRQSTKSQCDVFHFP